MKSCNEVTIQASVTWLHDLQFWYILETCQSGRGT